MDSLSSCELHSLQQALDMHAERLPHKTALAFLNDGQTVVEQLSFAELAQRTRALASGFANTGLVRGDRVLLMLDSGLDYACSFLACLYLGLIAVPLFPPASRKPRHLQRLNRVIDDAEPQLLLLSPQALELAEALQEERGKRVPVATATEVRERAGGEIPAPLHDREAPAFLQYTSGSTGDPKGVVVLQRNLLANLELMRQAMELSADDVWANWLPLYHDMGLIGSLLLPLYCGMSCYMTAPQTFARAPRTWLQIISRFGVTASFAPNFAFALCTRSIDDATLAELDLSRWSRALNGAEPIHKATVDAFCQRFAAAGFRPEAMSPAYGQAEATLVVSATPVLTGARYVRLQAAALAEGRAVVAADNDAQAITFTTCGLPQAGHEVRIVDPQTHRPCAPDTIGELWLAGPSNAECYWNKADISRETCAARIEGEEQPYLRSGDLGFLHEGQVVICARLKDLIILNGRNIYPQDLEFTLSESGIGLRSGRIAAFALTDAAAGSEQLLVVAEPQQKQTQPHTHAALFQAAQALAYELVEHPIDRLLLVKPGTIPMTTSGKISRQGAKQQFLSGELTIIGDSAAVPDSAALQSDDARIRELCALIAEVLRRPVVDACRSLLELGMDSLALLALQARLQQHYGKALALNVLFGATDVHALACSLDGLSAAPRGMDAAAEPGVNAPQSYAQQRLWFMDRLQPGSQHNLLLRLRLDPPADATRLHAALERAVERHAVLRTCYRDTADGAEQWLAPRPVFEWQHRAVADETERLLLAEELRARPFDLESGPVLRSCLLDLAEGAQEWLLAVHHIAFDARSAEILLDEIAADYAGKTVAPPRRDYRHFAVWERQRLTPDYIGRELDFWRAYLDVPALLALPVPDLHSTQGHGQHTVEIADEHWQALNRLALETRATPFMLLFALFGLLLRHFTGQTRFIVGTDVLGRSHSEHQHTVGFFINQLPLRCVVDDTLSLDQWLAVVKTDTQAAYAHQDLPFDQLVSGLKPLREPGRSPLVQVKLNYRQQGLDGLKLGASAVTQVRVEQEPADYDLVLDLIRGAQGLSCTFEYRHAALGARAAHKLAGLWQHLLSRLDELRPLTLAQIAVELDRWQAELERSAAPQARDRLSRISRRPLTA